LFPSSLTAQQANPQGICATQILDMAPGVMYDVYNAYERALYDAIDVPAAAL
jgi:hypothetical protein